MIRGKSENFFCQIGNNYHSCGKLNDGYFVYKQFYYFILLECYDVTRKPRTGEKYQKSSVIVVMDDELSGTTVASAFAGLEKGKVSWCRFSILRCGEKIRIFNYMYR